jgi:hypothetical protein
MNSDKLTQTLSKQKRLSASADPTEAKENRTEG